MDAHQHNILILDFGSQYAQLIARRVRELNVYCELHPFDVDPETIKALVPRGVIISGGPESVTADCTPRIPDLIFELGCPVLGVCYGMQAMAEQLGGKVKSASEKEFGHTQLRHLKASALFDDLPETLDVWMSHGDKVESLPPGFSKDAESDNAPIAAMSDPSRQLYAVQFHPEVTHTEGGQKLLSNFVKTICGCEPLWSPDNIIQSSIAEIRKTVGSDQVILGLSGGVDSSVVAALLHEAIPEQLSCIFVDTGLLRLGEVEQVMETFTDYSLIKVDARERFFEALKGVSDPEDKRRVIGKLFVEVFEAEAKRLKGVWLAQGTIYPDVIESAGIGKAAVIKSHHNVAGLPEKMNLKLLEPLREFFKDEVRMIGRELGLSSMLVDRHPFPGPGLGVRVLGEVKPDYVAILKQADAIFIEVLRQEGWYEKVSQAFAVFMPVKSVGVMGDARCYDYVIALRAVESTDFMTASWARLPQELLATVANRIINEVDGVARVTYDISSKPPATIEWE